MYEFEDEQILQELIDRRILPEFLLEMDFSTFSILDQMKVEEFMKKINEIPIDDLNEFLNDY